MKKKKFIKLYLLNAMKDYVVDSGEVGLKALELSVQRTYDNAELIYDQIKHEENLRRIKT